MNTSTFKYQVLKPDTYLDCAEFSLCPNCSSNIIKLVDGCSICGWSDRDKLLGGKENCSSNKFDTLEKKLSIPCLIKHSKKPEVKGIIYKDLGDLFTVYIPSNGTTVNVSKLLVYPDFFDVGDKRLLGGKEKCSSNCSSTLDKSSGKITSPPCTKTDKHRRQKGEGSGHIYYRTVTRNGRNYQQAYYQWRTEGKQRTKYIPVKLLEDIEEAEAQKLPVTKILELLQGGLNKCSSKKSDTSQNVLAKSESDGINPKCSSKINSPPCKDLENEEDRLDKGCSKSLDVLAIDESPKGYRDPFVGTISNNCSSKIASPPCNKKKRSAGCGGGYIEYREVKRNHKVYAQYWYHYEFWENGRCVEKKSKYIPKRLRSRIKRMNYDKAPVNEILKVLRGKRKK